MFPQSVHFHDSNIYVFVIWPEGLSAFHFSTHPCVCYIFFKLTLLTSFNNENVYRFIRWNAESRPEDSALFWAPTTDGLSCLNNISYAFPTKKHPEILNF